MTDIAFNDAAGTILAASSLSDEQRADVWDHYYSAGDHADLDSRLNNLGGIPPSVHTALVAAKRSEAPVPSNVDRAIEAIHRVAQLDPEVLELAEKYPVVMKGLVDASGR